MIEIYKQPNNGTVGILTDCSTGDDFVHDLASAIAQYVGEHPHDLEHDLNWLLCNAFAIVDKLGNDVTSHCPVIGNLILFAGDEIPTSEETPRVVIK